MPKKPPRLRMLKPLWPHRLDTRIATEVTAGNVLRSVRGRPAQRRNARILRRYPMCAICEHQGRATPSTQVDHRLPLIDGGTEDESNLWGLCDDCHAWKTAQEASRRARGLTDELPGLPPMKPPHDGPVIA